MISSSFPRQAIQHHSNPSLCPYHWCRRSWSWSVLWRPRRPPCTNTEKRCSIHHQRDWNATVGNQDIPGVTGKFGLGEQNEEGQRLTQLCQENALVIANTLFQQHERQIYTWTSPNGQYWNQIDYILCSRRWRRFIQSAETRPRADCGSDHQLLITKFRLTLKKTGKNTRPVRYELNQIPYELTVEVMNRFKGLTSVQSLSHVWLFADPWTAACQSITNSWSLFKLMSIESVMPSQPSHPLSSLLLLPSIFPSIRVFSNESLHQVAKILEFQLQHLSFQWIFRTDFL